MSYPGNQKFYYYIFFKYEGLVDGTEEDRTSLGSNGSRAYFELQKKLLPKMYYVLDANKSKGPLRTLTML